MAGRIPQHFIDDLLARIDIVDVIEGFVPLRKAGKNYQALCPFHDEKTPSFTVSRDKQFYHCFGCGANGTAITFLMEYDHLDFVAAVEELAARAGLEVPREGGGPARPRDDGLTELYELMELVVTFFRRQLREHADARRAVNYLKKRGISGEIAAEYELGFAPPGWDNLLKALGRSGEAQQRLARVGLAIERDGGGYYDRFRDRIMFPIRDQRGRAIGFGGRILDQGTPKYLNSPETPLFHKGRELYGLYQARRRHKDMDRLYVVEGYMDVLALAQYGVGNTVATLGTAATREHIDKLFKSSDRIVFCFDGDEAGRKAAWRALEETLPALREGRQAFFLFMPEGEDPDTYIRRHGREFLEDPAVAMPLSDYLINTLKEDSDLATREGRSRLLDRAVPYLSKLPQGALRQMVLRDIAGIARTPPEDIEPLLKGGPRPRRPATPGIKRGKAGRMTLVSRLITRLLYQPDLVRFIDDPDRLDEAPAAGADFLKELVEFIQARPHIRFAGILEHWRGTRFEARLTDLAIAGTDLLSEPELDGSLDTELLDGLERLQEQKRKHIRKKLTTVNRVSDLSDEERAELRAHIRRQNLTSEE
ncbi:MAG: DNA primase [Gammaproteobacteria bacterium]|jgi:DNA primase